MFLYPLRVVGRVECGDPAGVSTSVVLGDPWGFLITDSLINYQSIMVVVCYLQCLNGKSSGTPPSNGGMSEKCLDRQGPVGSVMVSTSLILVILLFCWTEGYFYRRKYDYILKTKRKIRGKFSFRLMLCDQARKKYGLVVLHMILKSLNRPNRPYNIICN